jgi:penicillin-binding protein 2
MKGRKRWSHQLESADSPRRPPKRAKRPLAQRLRHPKGRLNPKPKKRTPQPSRPPTGPRMRPKKSVAERVMPSTSGASRPGLRLGVLGVTVAALFALMLVRLWYLQVLDTTAYAQKVTANQVRAVQVSAPRGIIVDRSGGELVGNKVTEDITLSQLSAEQHPGVVGQLAALLGISPAQIEADLNNPRYSLYKPVPILENAPMAAVAAVKENPDLYPGVSAQVDSQLAYPMDQTGVQMLGYTRQITSEELSAHTDQGYQQGDQYGQDGLENEYEPYLHGTPGQQRVEVTAQGQVVGSLGETKPKPGDDVVTNIDGGLQQTLQTALDNEVGLLQGKVDPSTKSVEHPTGGAAVAIDPQTGAVLALASNPTYDPTIWESPTLSQAQIDGIYGAPDEPAGSPAPPAYDRAISGFYTPGSTFKLATATAALQTGLINPGTNYDDTGSFNIPGCQSGASGCATYHDNDGEAAGEINLTTALTVSSDTFFYNLGTEFWDSYKTNGQYGPQPIQTTANTYGYGEKTGIDLPGEDIGNYARVDSPAIRTKEHAQYPRAYPDASWGTGSNLEMAFGQGGTVITPLEQAVAYATFANGGTRYEPQIAAGIVSADGKVVKRFTPKVVGHVTLSPEDHAAMLQGFQGAVQSKSPLGTAYGAFQGFPFDKLSLAGKTGTASANEQVPTSWFVGWGPTDNARYLIAVVIEKGGFGADAAAPVAKAGFQYLVNHPEAAVRLATPPAPGSGSSTSTTGGPVGSTTTTTAVPSTSTTAVVPSITANGVTTTAAERSAVARSHLEAVRAEASDRPQRAPPRA